MFDGKFIYTLTAIIIAVFAICNFENKKKNNIVENFAGLVPGGKYKPSSYTIKNGVQYGTHSLGNANIISKSSTAQQTNNLLQSLTGGTASVSGPVSEYYSINKQHNQQHNQQYNREHFGFQVPANMQKMLSPRGSAESFGLGSNIRYNKPSFEKMAFPNPQQYKNMVQENYTGRQREQGCGVSGSPYQSAPFPPPSDYKNGDFNSLVNSLPKLHGVSTNQTLMNSLPIPTMEETAGGEEDVVNYNRMIISNPNSRLRGQGDPIRGDLVIAPAPTGWFRPSANPTLDLQQGALQVIAGIQSMDSNVSDGARLAASVGDNYYAGMLMNQQDLSSINAMTDLQVTRLP